MECGSRLGLLKGKHFGVGHVPCPLELRYPAPNNARFAHRQVSGHPFDPLEPHERQAVTVFVYKLRF